MASQPAALEVDLDALLALPLEEQAEEVARLKAWQELTTDNPLWLYVPHAKQRLYHEIDTYIGAFIGGNRCHVGSTLVRMADGSIKEIQNVRVGDTVIGCNEAGEGYPVKVKDVFCNGFAPCERFVFRNGRTEVEVTATADHRVATKGREVRSVRPLGEVTTGMFVSRGAGAQIDGPGDYEEYAAMLGMLLGDGSFHDGGPQGRICAFHNTEPDLIAAMSVEAERVGLRTTQRGPGTVSLVQREKAPKGWFLDLAEAFGLGRKAHQKRIPDFVWGWSNEAVGRLLAGLYMTDGWVHDRTIGIQLTSRVMVEQIRELLEWRFGVYGSATSTRIYPKDTHRDAYTLKIGANVCLARFAAAVPLTGQKRERLEARLEQARTQKQYDARDLRFAERHPVGDQLVWDLNVDHPSNMFLLANGIVTHNSGKSFGGTADDVIQAVDPGALPPWLVPYKRYHGEFRCRVVLPDLQYTLESALNLLRKLVPKHQLHKGSFDKAWDGRRRKLQFENGNWMDFMTHEMDLDQFGAIELERVRFDEEPPGNKGYKIFRECRMRVVSTGGDLRFTMTPLLGLSWTYYELTKDGEPKWDERVRVVTVDMDDNPHLVEAQKREALEGLSKQERQARKSGRFVHFEGLIYDEFRKDKHVVPEFNHLPDNAKLYEGIDPGLRNPAYVLVLIEDDDTMTVIDEIPPEPRTVAEMALMIHGKREQWGFKPKWTVIDPSARNKSHQTGRSDQAEYMDHGIYTLPGQNSRTAGFNRVKERLAPVDPDTGDSLEPRLYVAANCEELISQFTTYRWKERKGSEEEGKDEPVKARDHLLDALRYVIMSRPQKPNKPTPAQEPLSASQEAFHASIRDKTRKKRPRLSGLLG